MEALEHFPNDYKNSLRICLNFLKIFNIRYLEEDKTFLQRFWRYFYVIPVVMIEICALMFYMPVLLTGEDLSRVAFYLPPILVTIQTTFKGILLIPKTPEISMYIKELGSIWRTNFTPKQKKAIDALLWQLRMINKVSYWVTVFGSTEYLVSPLLETLVRRFILQQDTELLLPVAARYPFNPTKNWLIYFLTYIFQLFSMLHIVPLYMGSALIMVNLTALLAAEFIMLQDDLTTVHPKVNRNINRGGHKDGLCIEEFVIKHQKLIGLSRQLDNIFNALIFLDLMFVGITTCAFTFAAQLASGPTNLLVCYVGVVSSMLTILYLCYYGEILTGASATIGDLAYDTMWYEGGKQYKVAIWLIIKISQNPCCLTSLKYAVVSLNLFSKVVSTTWSYLSLINSVYSEEEQ